MHHIQGEFSVELSPQADEINTGRMLLNKTYKGALCGTSEGQMLSVRTDTPGSAGYVAIEQFSGTLDGKAGSFALQHSGTMNRGEASLTVSVIPDSASGDLTGLSGNMQITIENGAHYYDFNYVFTL
nr:DUF3224 domain-containing protein [Aestuariibacter sp. GS-14]